ncbi:MAG: AMP-binding protein [Bacteriovorax sp.]|jgi:acyl-coenzyme A synthetase/AMP-(fatty) acid ligase
MNCIDLFAQKSLEMQDQLAFVSPFGADHSFSDLRERVVRVQSSLRSLGFKKNDAVLMAIDVSIDLYSTVIAVLGLGGTIVLVEPWMPVKKISEVINLVLPKIFVSSMIGNLWGLRVSEIRQIPFWVTPAKLLSGKNAELICEPVNEKSPGVITFTTGTSGTPKGVVREHGYMLRQFDVLKNSLHFDAYQGSDLCIFANWTLLNLAQGKPTVFFPSKWSKRNFDWLQTASIKYNIQTLSSGPAFAKMLNSHVKLETLKDIHIGGALTPCSLFDELFRNYPESQIQQVYGSSEVEPVCLVDARLSVKKSREKNYYHSLYLGKPIDKIQFENKEDGMWVTGPHVCSFYLNNQKENELNKRLDNEKRIWHFMGDRITIDEQEDWWYSGRSQLSAEDFFLEQNLYVFLGHDNAFFYRDSTNKMLLIGEKLKSRQAILKQKFPVIDRIIEAKIIKDIRHRARIDRKAVLAKLKLG